MSKFLRILLSAFAGLASVVVFVPGVAHASFGPDMDFTMATNVSVGQTGLPASINLTNGSDGQEEGLSAVICNVGDNPPCLDPGTVTPDDDIGINLILSCGAFGANTTCASADPGVFQASPTGLGRTGTECDGTVFDIVEYNPAFGSLRFTPQPGALNVNANGNIVLIDPGVGCVVDFTVDVIGFPTTDRSAAPGVQTGQLGDVLAYSDTPGELPGEASDTRDITVSRAQPTISTDASATIALGGTITDRATVSGRAFPAPTADVTFDLYGPDNVTCAGPPVFSSTVTISDTNNVVDSAAFAPTAPGTYRWVASYGGDANNSPVAGVCGDPNETVEVTRAQPAIVTTASADQLFGGGPLTDTATVSGRVSPVAGATVTFNLYGPDDATCGASIFESVVVMTVGSDVVTSEGFAPTAPGTYRWIASYGGDANNLSVAGACNDPGESTVVDRAQPAITTDAGPTVRIGRELTDTATVTGLVAPVGSTVDFELYGPNDVDCSGAPVFTSLGNVLAAGDTTITSAGFTPTVAGTYRWVATYNGDVNNAPVAGECDDPTETVRVNRARPAITTDAGGDVVLGNELVDTATVTGLILPVGSTVDFELYGPDDATCANAPIFTSAGNVLAAGDTTITSTGFTPTTAGIYRWIARYNGDVNNAPVAGACGDPDETVEATRAQPAIVTTASADQFFGGGPLTDTATVSGRVSPVAGATVTFNLYGPDDATCGASIFESVVVMTVGSDVVTSEGFAPTAPGTYRWIASYGGDANNLSVAGACNDAGESTVVDRAQPAITTDAGGDITIGGELTDTATVTGLVLPVGSTVDFALYGPDDVDCSGAPVFTSSVVLDAGETVVTSGGFTPTAPGTYRWVAGYAGDVNNAPVAGVCGDPDETVEVDRAQPAITTDAGANVVIGSELTDTATVTGLVAPIGSTVDFALYGPDDVDCSGAPVFTSSIALGAADSVVTSGGFTPTDLGIYRWVASYAGDANNAPIAGVCGDPDETVQVARALPGITTDAGDDVTIGAGSTVGGGLTDTATVTGLVAPIGSTVDFALYGPDDVDCSGAPVFTSSIVLGAADNVATSEGFTPTVAGTYRWVAAYAGDANNAPVSGVCGDPTETVTVARAQPAITTDGGADVVLGAELTDTATVSGLVLPIGSTVEFALYGPDDATCSGAPVFTSSIVLGAADTVVTSEGFTPTVAGTYRWVAAYAGDANNAPVSGVCGDPTETVAVQLGNPTIVTQTTPAVIAGQGEAFDTATVSGRINPQDGATIDFRLYGPGDTACSEAPLFESLGVPYPVAGGPVRSASFTPVVVGTYRWVATYSGDANNASVAGECGDPDETFEVLLDPEAILPATGSDGGIVLRSAAGISIAGLALLLFGRRRRARLTT